MRTWRTRRAVSLRPARFVILNEVKNLSLREGTLLPSVAMRQNLTALLWETKVPVVANIAHSQCPPKRVEELFATVNVCSNRFRIVRVVNNKRKHFNCPSLPRGTSNVVAEGDGKLLPRGHDMPCPYAVCEKSDALRGSTIPLARNHYCCDVICVPNVL